MFYFIQYNYHTHCGGLLMAYKSKKHIHVIIRFMLSVYSILIFFFPVYEDLSGYSITYFQFQLIFSIPVIFFIFMHFILSAGEMTKPYRNKKYNIGFNDCLWFLMMAISILNTYVLRTSQTVYNRFEVSYLVNHERFPNITSIKDYVMISYQVYHVTAIAIVLGIYLISIYLSPFIRYMKKF